MLDCEQKLFRQMVVIMCIEKFWNHITASFGGMGITSIDFIKILCHQRDCVMC